MSSHSNDREQNGRTTLGRATPWFLLLSLGVWLVPPAGAFCQEPTRAEPGDTIRVATSGEPRVKGLLVAWENDRLVVRPHGEETDRTIPLANVEEVELYAGMKRNAGRGALIGGGVGAGFGLVAGVAAASDDSGLIDFGAEIIPLSAALFGGVGAGVGALLGDAFSTERWVTVPLTGLELRIGPTFGGESGLSFSLSPG